MQRSYIQNTKYPYEKHSATVGSVEMGMGPVNQIPATHLQCICLSAIHVEYILLGIQ